MIRVFVDGLELDLELGQAQGRPLEKVIKVQFARELMCVLLMDQGAQHRILVHFDFEQVMALCTQGCGAHIRIKERIDMVE